MEEARRRMLEAQRLYNEADERGEPKEVLEVLGNEGFRLIDEYLTLLFASGFVMKPVECTREEDPEGQSLSDDA